MEVALNNPSTTAASCLKKLREEISGAGVAWGDFRKLLPDWSDDAIKHISGVTEIRGFAMKHLGLQAANDGGLRFRSLPNAAFKTRKGTDLAQIQGARAFAGSVARLLSNAMTVPWKGLPDDVDWVRTAALSASNNPWVDFTGLLDVAWSAGIPVAYLPKLPTTGKKMEGMVTFVGGRPVIVISKKNDRPDWNLFILAHELGHIAKRHVPEVEGESLIDEAVGETDEMAGPDDNQEVEANAFASQVTSEGGDPIILNGPAPKAEALAPEALEYGRANHVSPGHVLLNMANHNLIGGHKPFGLAAAALKIVDLELGQQDTAVICQAAAERYLDLGRLRDDSAEFLEKLGAVGAH